MNIIIPIGGIGSRFATEGYRYPKPLINIVGRPMLFWLIDRLSLTNEDAVFIAVTEALEEEFEFSRLVQKEFPHLHIRVLVLRHQTQGASETLYIATQSIPFELRERRTMSLDCDTIYFADILEKVRSLRPGWGGTVVFEDYGNKPIFSYVKEERGVISEIVEKQAVSNLANTGAYIFPSATILRDYAADVLNIKLDKKALIPEYFTSSIISLMLQDGHSFRALPIRTKDFVCVGTPKQLRDFLSVLHKDPDLAKLKPRRFCFDLDSTLVTLPTTPGDYSTCKPIWKNIKLLQGLHKGGNHIIIQTARRMKTHHGNVGAVIADIGPVTFQTLAEFNIPYHEIFFGKPYAHVYIDDHAVNALFDTRQEIGWHHEGLAPEEEAAKAGLVAARSFNTVQAIGDKVIKSSQFDALLGEMFFYAHMPDSVKDLFPTIYDLKYLEKTKTFSIEMNKIRGTTFSHLLVGRSLTEGRLLTYLQGLNRLHTSSAACATPLSVPDAIKDIFDASKSSPESINIYQNYASKLKKRMVDHKEIYASLQASDLESMQKTLLEGLESYEKEDRGVHANIIHGDPVFSNGILTPVGGIAFLDVRGQLGSEFSLAGDAVYDLAKLYQSIRGYDHALLDDKSEDEDESLKSVVDEFEQSILKDLQLVFWKFVAKTYPTVQKSDIMLVTASLLYTLIPLHGPKKRPIFLQMCREVLQDRSC